VARITHVSIHDVTPATAPEVERAIVICDEVGVRPALLVVPNYHGRWPLERYPAFVTRLRELQDRGHEILLHGLFHHAPDAARGVRAALAQRVMSAAEAEFVAIDQCEAEQRLDDGLAMLGSLGLAVRGFVPPAWQMMPWLLPLLASRKVGYTEDHFRVYDPIARRSRRSLVLNFASRTPLRLWSSLAFVRAALPAHGILPTRVAIHPRDLDHDVLVRATRRVLRVTRGTFVASSADLLR
jgi:predicted deacetylase